MSKIFRRGALAAAAAGAMAVTLTAPAMAVVDDPDIGIGVDVPREHVSRAEVLRIADTTRITTAVEASQSRSWGRISDDSTTSRFFECEANQHWLHNQPVPPDQYDKWQVGEVFYPVLQEGVGGPVYVKCEVVARTSEAYSGSLDIIVARSDDYPDAIAAAPLADVLNAPILIHPPDLVAPGILHPAVDAEIKRLAASYGDDLDVTVHLLGGTDALSHGVENWIDGIPGVDETIRYQGVDRFQTAANIAKVTVDHYGLHSGADGNDVNVYLATGTNYPDALAAGAAAAENDGVVLLTNGESLDRRGFTDEFLMGLETWVRDDRWDINTSENFAIGGPAVRAADAYDIRTAGEYWGVNRYETATITAEETFDLNPVGRDNFAVVSGETYADAIVASGYIANLDGPLLLSNPTELNEYTAAYLRANVEDGDRIITFGGPDALRVAVTNQIKALLAAKFAVDPEIE